MEIPLKLNWKQKKDIPFAMWYYPQAVVVEEKVFMGGGRAPSKLERQNLMVYDLLLDEWHLLQCGVMWSAMTVLKNQLVLVGGRDANTDKRVSSLRLLKDLEGKDSQTWSFPFPPMSAARDGATAVVHDNRWLVVIGGWGDDAIDEGELSKVEIMDTSSKQWYICAPLPQPCGHISATIIENMLLLMGGFSRSRSSKKVFSVCVDDLIHEATSRANTLLGQSPWCTLPDTPVSFTTALSLNGALLAVGGLQDGHEIKTIHLYQPSTKTWVKAGELPIERWQCACVVLPNGEVFVAGNGDMALKRMDIAVVM